MDDFFQTLRRVQKEERNKSTLARVDNDFYKKLYAYIRGLERSVAKNPFDNNQSKLLANAQRVATDICEMRETKISNAANSNIYRSFHLFKRDNPQFDLLDTTPLNLTDEEETLYFSLMDALRSHRYRISLDKFAEDKNQSDETIKFDDDEDYEMEKNRQRVTYSSRENQGVISDEEFFKDGHSDSIVIGEESGRAESDEVLNRLDQIKNAKVVEDESYEPIEKQIANQRAGAVSSPADASVSSGGHVSSPEDSIESDDGLESPLQEDSQVQEVSHDVQVQGASEVSQVQEGLADVQVQGASEVSQDVQVQESVEESIVEDEVSPDSSSNEEAIVKPSSAETKEENRNIHKKPKAHTLDFDTIFKNPDSQFVDLDGLEPNYDDDFDRINASSKFAEPSADDFKIPPIGKRSKPSPKKENKESVLEAESTESSPAKSRPINELAKKEELENTAVVIYKDLNQIVGIDEKVYGPFLAEDVVILPNITARILIDSNKAGLINI